MSCSAVHCSSRTTKGGVKDPDLSFHLFPKCLEIRREWIKAVRRDNWEPTKYSRLCSKHFEETCFITGLLIKKLKSDAIPTIFEEYPLYYKPIPTDMLLSNMNSKTSIDKSESMKEEIVSPKSTMHCQPNETIDKTKEDSSSTESAASGDLAPYLSYTTELTITRQLENICRLCLKEKGTWDLTRSYISDTGQEVFNDMLWDCFGLKMPRLTYCGVSKLICSDCAASLQQAYNFKQQVVLASATFNSYCDRYFADSTESELAIYKSEANGKTPSLRKILQKAQQNLNHTEKKNENDNMSTPTSKNVSKNVVIDHNYSKSGQEEIPTLTKYKIRKNDKKTSKEIDIQPRRKGLPAKKSTRKRPTNTTKKSGSTGRIVKKSVRRIIIDIDQINRKLSARKPNKSVKKELDNPINFDEDTVINEVELDTVITDDELDTVINEDQLDVPIKHKWETPMTEKKGPLTFQVGIPEKDSVIIKEEYDLEIKGPSYKKPVKTVSERKRIRLTCETVLKHTSACPFRHHKSWFRCFYCTEDFIELKQLKDHTLKNHSAEELKNIKRYPRSLQIDITDFKCHICDVNLTDVKSMVGHFGEVHKMAAYKECIADYKVDKSPYSCHLCSKQYHVFRLLTTHLNVHYANYICDICGKSFINTKRLKVHKRTHENGIFPCNICGKIMKTLTSKANHMETHSKRVLKCQICFKPMKHYNERIKHMSEEHKITHIFKCYICGKEYNIKHYLATHMRQTHGNKDKKCGECDMAFATNHGLKKHMLKHTGVKTFTCAICAKSFARSYTLKEHMRGHGG